MSPPFIYLVEKGVVLINHQKLGKWVAPGGHVELNEMPHETAIREAKEETGLDIQLLDMDPLKINDQNATTIPSPYMMMLHPVNFPCPHEHVNFVYLAKALHPFLKGNEESSGIKWFLPLEIKKLSDKEIFEDTTKTLNHLFSLDLFPLAYKFDTMNPL